MRIPSVVSAEIQSLTPVTTPSVSEPAKITLPAHLFGAHHLGEKWMVAIEPDGTTHVDGGHSTKAGVAKAKALYESITIIRPPEGTRYVMLTVEAIPEGKPRLNQSAIKTLNAISR